MAQAINPDTDMSGDSPTNNQPNDNVPEMKTQDKMKLMASQFKTKSKENAKKMAVKSKQRLSLEGQLRQARISLERYVNPKLMNRPLREDTLIPRWVLKKAKGLVFLTVVKAGFLFAGNVGTGCVIVRKPNGGWTGPSSIAVAGVSFGFLAGVSKVDYMMILPDDAAVKQFTGAGQLRLGGEIQVALGPVGREGSGSIGAGDKGVSVIFSYSHAQGLYGGLAFDGKIISVRPDCNDKYYGRKVTCFEILTGEIDPPLNEDYDTIVHLLDGHCNDDLTPMKGERISIDDLDKQTNPQPGSNVDGNGTDKGNGKQQQQQAQSKSSGPAPTVDKSASDIMDEFGTKFQSGFNNLRSMLFKKNKNDTSFERIGNSNNNNNSNDNNNGVMKSAAMNDNTGHNNDNNDNSLSPPSNSSDNDNRPPF